MFLFRRANNIHKQLLYNSHHIFIPRITLPNDIQYLAEYIPTCKEVYFEFFEYEFDSEEQNTVKLDLTNDTLEIVE